MFPWWEQTFDSGAVASSPVRTENQAELGGLASLHVTVKVLLPHVSGRRRTNTNSAFYPFRGGVTRFASRRIAAGGLSVRGRKGRRDDSYTVGAVVGMGAVLMMAASRMVLPSWLASQRRCVVSRSSTVAFSLTSTYIALPPSRAGSAKWLLGPVQIASEDAPSAPRLVRGRAATVG
jgi:hypothetical protein